MLYLNPLLSMTACRASLPVCGDAEGDDQIRNEHRSHELLPWLT